MKKVSYVVLLFVVSVLSSVSSSYAYAADINHIYDVGEIMLYDGTSITQLTNNDYNDSCPQINDNGWVVWEACVGQTQDWCDRDEEIFLYDGTSTIQLTDNDYEDVGPQINNNGYVVWKGCDGPGTCEFRNESGEIFLYNGTSTMQLTDNDYDDSSPQINNNGWVVWQGFDGSDREIFLYDGTSTIQLTTNDYDDWAPQINNNGWVVWSGVVGPVPRNRTGMNPDGEIFLYDGTSTIQLTDNDYDDGSPQINNNGWVVWDGDEHWAGEIFLYDGTSTTQLTNNYWSGWRSQINDNGYVIWSGATFHLLSQGYNFDSEQIFLYDGTRKTRLTYDVLINQYPQINDSGYVIWSGGTFPYFRWLIGRNDIFFYNGTSITKISNNLFDGWDPHINDNGWVVWYATPSQCFIATAAFGTELDGKIDVLRSFRDTYLMNNAVGQSFIITYYKHSPPIADYVAGRPWLRSLVRILLLPVIGVVSLVV